MHSYSKTRRSGALFWGVALANLPTAIAEGFIRDTCYALLKNMTSVNPALLSDPSVFSTSASGQLQNNMSNPSVTLSWCELQCGSGIFGLYPDATARLLTWLVPSVLLVTGMGYASVGCGRFLMLPHLFGDPIDSVWGLLGKIEGWNRCYAMARELYADIVDDDKEYESRVKDVAVIIAAIEELFGQVRQSNEERDEESQLHGDSGKGKSNSRVKLKGTSSSSKFLRQSITTVEFGRVESTPHSTKYTTTHAEGFTIAQTPFCPCTCTNPSLTQVYAKTARRLLDSRVNGTLQAIFSIGVYIVGTLAAFIPAFGGNPNPSGGKIASSMILSWLLPTVLLSNVVGQWKSPRDSFDAVWAFKEELERCGGEERGGGTRGGADAGGSMKGGDSSTQNASKTSLLRSPLRSPTCTCTSTPTQSWLDSMNAQNWIHYSKHLARTGSVYSFRLNKCLPILSTSTPTRPPRLHEHWQLLLLAVLPVFVSFMSAGIVLWSPPTYFSCRHFMLCGIFAAWGVNAILTSLPQLTSHFRASLPFSRQWIWRVVAVKDTIFSTAIITLLILSASGLFNSCWCWTGWYWLHWFTKDSQVQLNPGGQFDKNNGFVYPIAVGLTLGMQGVIFGAWAWVGRDVFFGMMRRGEENKWKVVLRGRGRRVAGDEEMRVVAAATLNEEQR